MVSVSLRSTALTRDVFSRVWYPPPLLIWTEPTPSWVAPAAELRKRVSAFACCKNAYVLCWHSGSAFGWAFVWNETCYVERLCSYCVNDAHCAASSENDCGERPCFCCVSDVHCAVL